MAQATPIPMDPINTDIDIRETSWMHFDEDGPTVQNHTEIHLEREGQGKFYARFFLSRVSAQNLKDAKDIKHFLNKNVGNYDGNQVNGSADLARDLAAHCTLPNSTIFWDAENRIVKITMRFEQN